MVDYIGKRVNVKTKDGSLKGKLLSFNEEDGKVTIEDALFNKKLLDFEDIIEMDSEEDVSKTMHPYGLPLDEKRMYNLFYEAFNIYGPLEDSFCHSAAAGLKKFLKDLPNAKVKVIIGSDDIFGRIGLYFAKMIFDRAKTVDVILSCNLFDLRTLKYKDIFLNSGGKFSDSDFNEQYTMAVYACNRHFDFKSMPTQTKQSMILDLPSEPPFETFSAYGLGMIPENYKICPNQFFIVDVGFCNILIEKYQICNHTANNLFRVPISSLNF